MLAAGVAHAARRLWRRCDLEAGDEVVLDHLVESLYRLSIAYQPGVGEPAVEALEKAPEHVRGIVDRLLPVAWAPPRRGGAAAGVGGDLAVGVLGVVEEETVEEVAVAVAVEQ